VNREVGAWVMADDLCHCLVIGFPDFDLPVSLVID
jgi:hypothetical protein